MPESEFESNLTRFELPASAVAYGPDGKLLAAACEDGTISLIEVADQRVCSNFGTHPAVPKIAYSSALFPCPVARAALALSRTSSWPASQHHVAVV